MDTKEKQRIIERLKSQIRQRLRECAPEDFSAVRRKALRYVHEKGWPQREIRDVQVIVMKVREERAPELEAEPQEEPRRMRSFLQLFEHWDSIPDGIRLECRRQFECGRKEVSTAR